MMDAISSFDTPDAVMLSQKEGKIELVLKGTDRKGNKLLSIVALNAYTRNAKNFIETHIVTSIYGRRNIEKYVDKARSEGRRLITKKKSQRKAFPKYNTRAISTQTLIK